MIITLLRKEDCFCVYQSRGGSELKIQHDVSTSEVFI